MGRRVKERKVGRPKGLRQVERFSDDCCGVPQAEKAGSDTLARMAKKPAATTRQDLRPGTLDADCRITLLAGPVQFIAAGTAALGTNTIDGSGVDSDL